MDCLFCKIINNEIPSLKIFEDEYVLAFLDINPDSDGHTLIIPKKHFTDIMDIDNEYLIKIFESARGVKALLEDKLKCDGIIFQQNNGKAQEVKHYHLHIKPYYSNNSTIELNVQRDKLKDPKDIFEILTKNNK